MYDKHQTQGKVKPPILSGEKEMIQAHLDELEIVYRNRSRTPK
jgi:hypothetical protein